MRVICTFQFIDIVILITKMLNWALGTKGLKLLRSFNKHYSNIYSQVEWIFPFIIQP